MDEQARKWLEKHNHELPLEEIVPEIEKAKKSNNSWPIPELVPHMGIFSNINSQDKFNEIIGDPKNWPTIYVRRDLYVRWIVPNAILLFGKIWFDRAKWRKSIHKGVPFPLFGSEEKIIANKNGQKLEDTTHGRAIIAKIINKVEYALGIYLEGKWLEKSNYMKKPGGYIIDSIKNEFIREIGNDLGYKLKSVLACPYCLSNKIQQKTPLIYHGSLQYSCPHCDEYYENLKYTYENSKDPEILDKIKNVKVFKKFIGITCVCPSDKCKGKFVPINSIDFENWHTKSPKDKLVNLGKIIKTISVPKNIQGFVKPPPEIAELPLLCPFCNTKFFPSAALKSKTGFKGKSGFLTGLPTISIWEQKCSMTLDQRKGLEEFSPKNNIASEFFDLDNHILAKQNINILIDEIICQMAKIKPNSVASLTTWYFYMASIKWMINYWQDAFRYFFGWSVRERNMTKKERALYPGERKKKVTDVIRGQMASIHQSLFYTWMNILENNISKFNRFDSNIQSLKNFKWFCRPPKFSGGPLSVFVSKVNSKLKIPNNSDIIDLRSRKFSPRIAKIYSIYKISNGKIIYEYNFKNDIKFCEWQSIQLKNCRLKPGDTVRVGALMMSGHTTHAPIQRIIRLRTKILGPLIQRIQKEEEAGERDLNFWNIWENRVIRARKVTGIDIKLKE